VPEAGREITEQKLAALGPGTPMEALTWDSSDFVDIAREQARREDVAARSGAPVVLCDTDAFATGIWHERYRGRPSSAVDELGGAAPFHLYLLTHHDDVPFEQDGLRDGEQVRAWMTGRFAERLDATSRHWQWLRGGRDERETRALAAIDTLLRSGWNFAAPLG
jgi:nicotinamide riboside kinase